MEQKKYTPKPFTQQLAEQAYKDMYVPQDKKRTLCNVIKQAYRAVQDDSYNLAAARDLLLEALWMGQRMHSKLYDEQVKQLRSEEHDDVDEFDFSVDWSKLDGRNVAQGNWD